MKKIIWTLFFLILSALSYLREILFLSVNAVIAGKKVFYAKTTRLDFLLDKSPADLIQLKYALTVSFTILFAIITISGLKKVFTSKLPYYISISLYGIAFLIGSLMILYSLIVEDLNSVYSFLRLIIEYLHNPLIYIVLSAAYLGFYYSQSKTKDQQEA